MATVGISLPRDRFLRRLAAAIHLLGIGTIGGALAGLVAGGLGSRIAMRIVAIVAGPSSTGMITENGNRVGDVTLGGTVELLVFAGLFPGIAAGLLYVAVRTWLTASTRWPGLVFGLLLLATFGFAIISPGNADFRRFGSPVMNVGLFAALFLALGLLVVPIVEWLARSAPTLPSGRAPGFRTLAASATVALTGLLTLFLLVLGARDLVIAVLGVSTGDVVPDIPQLFYSVLAIATAAHLARQTVIQAGDPTRNRLAIIAGAVALAIPVLVGARLTLLAIADIL